MKNNFYKEGFYLTIQNAENLFNIGVMAAANGFYGNACALNVLAAEESVKAAFILIPHYYNGVKVNNYTAIFSKHRVKHNELKEFIKQQDKLRNETLIKLEQFQSFLNIARSIAPEKENSKEFKELKDDLIWFKKQSEIVFDKNRVLDWLKKADNIKNSGLYVAEMEKKSKWFSPTMITKEKYEIEKEYTSSIIKYIKSLDEWFTRTQNIQN